jgi:hypothetical protein
MSADKDKQTARNLMRDAQGSKGDPIPLLQIADELEKIGENDSADQVREWAAEAEVA